MTQIHVDKDRSYKMHGGKFLDDFNEGLAEDYENSRHLPNLHPTKGFRRMSRRRLTASMGVEPSMHGWSAIAAKVAGSRIGGEPQERPTKIVQRPHQGKRECLRRMRQMAVTHPIS